MFNANSRGAVTALALLVVGCVTPQTPAQVAAPDPVRVIAFTTSTAAMVECLPARMGDLYSWWTVSVSGELDRPRIHAHGGVDIGTVALIVLDNGRATLRLTTNISRKKAFKRYADELEEAISACDKP